MINLDVCTFKSVGGASLAESELGKDGHAIWGPYEPLMAGEYKALFQVAPIDLDECSDDDVVATIDIAIDYARDIPATKNITAADLRAGKNKFLLTFVLKQKAIAEYRIQVYGNARLELNAYTSCAPIAAADETLEFPKIGYDTPDIIRKHQARFRHLFERGFGVSVRANDVVLSKDGIKFFARVLDDINLIEEIFIEQVYRFERNRPTVVIDIGMNIGLVSMQFAKNPAVQKVYSFDPFRSTFDRAIDNLALNPEISKKIMPSNTGVSNTEGRLKFNVHDTSDSGSRSTRDDESGMGVPIELEMQTASNVLRMVRTNNPDTDIIIKIDCEGAEFAIFDDLATSELLSEVTAFMVEWHTVFPGKNQADLIAPLNDAGFTVIDRSPMNGNGFFYAVR